MISTKTTTGTPVTLTGTEYHDRPAVRVQFESAGRGPVDFVAEQYVHQKGVGGIPGLVAGQRCLVTVPAADFAAAMAEARQIGESDAAAIRGGDKKIRVRWQDGSPLSGYVADGARENGLLLGLGVASEVSGWGTLVDRRMVESLGEEFTFAQAEAYARQKHAPAREASEARRKADEQKIAAAAATARQSGEPVAVETRLVGETDSGHVFETRYVGPDGDTFVREFRE